MSAPRRGGRRLRGGTLMLIAAMLVGSALVRLGIAAPALAREAASPGPAGSPAASAPDDADLQRLILTLQRREADLDARAVQIEDRMQALGIAEAALERQLADLEAAEGRLKATLALADSAAEGDLSRLTEVYERMKAKDTAALFQEMDPGFAAGFLGRMRPEAAAAVLAGMDPGAAYAISVILAGRNAGVPTE